MPRPADVGPVDPRLVARLHVDLLRVSSAGCRRSR
ncbi:putative leader peptide [Frankia sp. EI5c]|nr:putative leader peptide [Frankia sp. EI5c]